MKNILVIGGGAMGSAFTIPCLENNNKVVITEPYSKRFIKDLSSKNKMFRLLQGDVGSGKTVVALISALNVIESGYQVAFMAPTEILSRQHYNLAKKIFPNNINLEILTSKTEYKEKKRIQENINTVQLIFGTHSLFQKKLILVIWVISL